jgi:DNA-nicking Smr family endonuclease
MTERKLTDAETRAWARIARTVTPIHPGSGELQDMRELLQAGLEDQMPRPAAPAAPRSRAIPAAPPARPQDRAGEKRVRRGRIALSASLDLHGHTQDSAAAVLPHFLAGQRKQGARCVLIITGKGRNQEGVLRRNFLHWLESQAAQAFVSGYAEAHPRHGGAGAFYVFLRRAPG